MDMDAYKRDTLKYFRDQIESSDFGQAQPPEDCTFLDAKRYQTKQSTAHLIGNMGQEKYLKGTGLIDANEVRDMRTSFIVNDLEQDLKHA